MAVEAFAAAKINLSLHVTGRRADGYHLLDSLVVFASVGDRVTVDPAADWSLRITGPMAGQVPGGEDNLVLRAARLTGGPPAQITLEKRLPVASGLGGGSSDAAATLHALHALDGRPLPDPTTLGADVPVCLRGRPCRMRGVGEALSDLPDLPPLHGVLVNPGAGLATADVFRALTRKTNAAMPPDLPEWRDAPALAAWLGGMRNDLERPARGLAPAVGVALSRLSATEGCLIARMSGSGATCFALYATAPEAEAAADALGGMHPDWWIAATRLGAAQTIRATT